MDMSAFPLPLTPNAPPLGYGWEERDISNISTTTAFKTGIDQRDIFLGESRCVVCGGTIALEYCHVIMDSEPHIASRKIV